MEVSVLYPVNLRMKSQIRDAAGALLYAENVFGNMQRPNKECYGKVGKVPSCNAQESRNYPLGVSDFGILMDGASLGNEMIDPCQSHLHFLQSS